MNGKAIKNVMLPGLVSLGLAFVSCSPPQGPAPPAAAPAAQGSAGVAQQGWAADWESTVAGAKKEGGLNIYTVSGPELRVVVSKAIKDKYGFDIEWTAGKAAELPQKIQTERRAGLFLADLIMGSTTRQLTVLRPEGMLEPIKPLLVLPEVLDKTVWAGGDIPWVDNDKQYIINTILGPDRRLAINTDMVRPGQITSFNDLLDPRWKGKITVPNPRMTMKFFSELSIVMGVDWWKKLVANSPVVFDDARLGIEWLARGKYPVMIYNNAQIWYDFVQAGAPIKKEILKEENFLTGGAIPTSFFNRAPHPNAAKVFVNWYLSKEGSTVLTRVIGVQSARLDAPIDHLPADELRQASATYVITEAEDFFLLNARDQDLAEQIFAPVLK
ncbi:MAG: extracellular solute-binding protein [Chloroflexi bacterium]|nr:extracellular solute-binding protein [Chloroflexota bacterium]